jgi:hypothetical protein
MTSHQDIKFKSVKRASLARSNVLLICRMQLFQRRLVADILHLAVVAALRAG